MAARRRFLSCERLVPTEDLVKEGPVQSLRINRMMTDGVVEAPHGAHFTSCDPDYERDEDFQRKYATAAGDAEAWAAFQHSYLALPTDRVGIPKANLALARSGRVPIGPVLSNALPAMSSIARLDPTRRGDSSWPSSMP